MEILSPASNMEHIKVATLHGANAVYGGLKKWNARNKAINFSKEEYNELIIELHKHNIKFFLTLNILMLDEEIEEVIEFLKNNELPDSFIVTDIGLITILSKEFPTVPLHFSTQFGAHNIDDVNYIESIGGKRAILARELTKEEIKEIRNKTNIELETFIWGSQCLSFSGLCFFGTLINGGGGNRGKCIITCRDVYSINEDKGHYLYVPDMNCIDSIDELKNIDCLKLEGRRRPPQEIASVLDDISNKNNCHEKVGYLYGTSVADNKQYEKINSRIKPLFSPKELPKINEFDIFMNFEEDKPIDFSNEFENDNVKYVYSEIKKSYDLSKKNITLDFVIKNSNISEILYVNYKGDGHTFFENNDNKIEFSFIKLRDDLEKINSNINLYKIKYKRNLEDKYFINESLYNEVLNYIINDCKNVINDFDLKRNFKLNQLYLETSNEEIIDKYINDEFIKIIYNIETVKKMKNIEHITLKYDDKVIYKLPMFNWKGFDLIESYKYLENKEVMFTRLSQIYITKDVKFKKKYADYTIYVWNHEALTYLKNNGIDEFTGSPELSYELNKKIYSNNDFQMIIVGKMPLVYTRGCFGHILGCGSCLNSKQKYKSIKNEDKDLLFDIICKDDYRMLLYKYPVLNNYSKVDITTNTKFRYIVSNETQEEIDKTVRIMKNTNFYDELKKINFWKNSYECNLIESRD